MRRERELLERYVHDGKLMQLATINSDGSPALCHVWYQASFAPDRLYFVSRHDRQHSINIRFRKVVAGGIVSIPLDQLGQTVRGVTFAGQARELPTTGIEQQIAAFVERWPNADNALDSVKLAQTTTPSRLYEITITSWVLFDEENFPDDPKRPINGERQPRFDS